MYSVYFTSSIDLHFNNDYLYHYCVHIQVILQASLTVRWMLKCTLHIDRGGMLTCIPLIDNELTITPYSCWKTKDSLII